MLQNILWKKVCLFLFIMLAYSHFVKAQGNEILVVCAYDYKKALQLDGKTDLPDTSTIPYYLKVQLVDSIYAIEEINSCAEGCKKVFNNNKNILIYVHGFGTDLNSLILSSKQLIDLYDVNLVLFAWPANDARANPLINYHEAKKNAGNLENTFLESINTVFQHGIEKEAKVSILFHSLGNIYAEYCADHIAEIKKQGIIFDNIILNAPCVPAKNHYKWVQKLGDIVKQDVFVVFNENDKILNSVRYFLEVRRVLGQTPVKPYANNVKYVDFTMALEKETHYSSSHTYFINRAPEESKNICNFYKTIFNGNELSFQKNEILATASDKVGYSILY